MTRELREAQLGTQSFSSQGQGSSKALSGRVTPFPYSYEDIGLDRVSDLPKLHSPLVARLMSMSSEGTKVSTEILLTKLFCAHIHATMS